MSGSSRRLERRREYAFVERYAGRDWLIAILRQRESDLNFSQIDIIPGLYVKWDKWKKGGGRIEHGFAALNTGNKLIA